MHRQHGFRHGQRQAQKEHFFASETTIGQIGVHQIWMPGYDSTHFYRKLVARASQIVKAEVEDPDSGVPVESIHYVPSALVAYLTVRQVQLAKWRPVKNDELPHDRGSFEGEAVPGQIEVAKPLVELEFSDELFQVVYEKDGSEHWDTMELLLMVPHQLR